jgi:DNA-binding MarR family transcriptional regulator
LSVVTSTLHLLFEPRETLRVLEYVNARPRGSPGDSARELHISLHTWYAAIERLESLGLVNVERVPGGRKTRRIEVTSSGRTLLDTLAALPPLVAGSPGFLSSELRHGDMILPPERRGELLCALVDHAERRGDFASLEHLAAEARAAGRPGEAALAAGISAYLHGEAVEALKQMTQAATALEAEADSRSLRKALYFRALSLDALGDARGAYVTFTRLRRLARVKGDVSSEIDARLGIGIMKARRGQYGDAVVQLEKALDRARRSKLAGKEAKVLTSLSLVRFLLDERRGLSIADEALAVATEAGSKVLLVHIHANRALMLAVLGERREALASLSCMRKMARAAGYERGQAALAAWVSLTKRISQGRRQGDPIDWRGQVLEILQTPPSQPPATPRARHTGHARSQSTATQGHSQNA